MTRTCLSCKGSGVGPRGGYTSYDPPCLECGGTGRCEICSCCGRSVEEVEDDPCDRCRYPQNGDDATDGVQQ